ncbi:uncharacterized protein TNCV_2983481 [Trichonephila clavipes]|nr:uncharacterized protein TNCV_2983481 [Trichonephila clavipes]
MKIITSCAADGAPNMMDKKNGCLKLMKDANPEMILVHCVIHMQNLVAKNISPVLNEVLHTVIKCVNVIKATARCERLFMLFCEEQNEDHERFLDLKQIDFPTWMMQAMLADLSDISNMQYPAELAELQNDDSVKTLFSIKGAMAWLREETEIKYPNSTKYERKLLLPFPSSFLAECGFSAVNDLL